MDTLAQVDFGRSLQNVLDAIARIVPRLVVFVIILVIGWIIAKAIQRAVAMILRRLHFDRVAERGVVGDALRRGRYDASGLLARLVYYAILLVTLQLAFNVFGPNPVSNVLRSIVAWLPRLAVAVIIVIIASAIAHAVRDIVGSAIAGLTYGRFLADLASIFIIALGVIAALNQIGVATTVTEPVLITVLATIGAVIAIGVGGGMIRPMQQRWERILSRAERETAEVRGGAYARGREDALRGGGTPTEAPPRPGEPTAPSGPEERAGAAARTEERSGAATRTEERAGSPAPPERQSPPSPSRPEEGAGSPERRAEGPPPKSASPEAPPGPHGTPTDPHPGPHDGPR